VLDHIVRDNRKRACSGLNTGITRYGGVMELPQDDLELINALQIAPRISWTQAGEILGKHPTTLAARWQRLREAGLAWVTGTLLGAPGSTTLSFHDIVCEPGRRQDVIRALCNIPEVISVEESAHNRNLVLTVSTPSWAELTRRVIPQFSGIPGVLTFKSIVVTTLHSSGNAWRLDTLSHHQQTALKTAAGRPPPYSGRLPATYWPIVRMLVRDGRATPVEIAQATGQHPSTARRQLTRVLDSGALAFRCELAQDYSGFPITCQWYAHVPPRDQGSAASFMAGYRNIRLCASTTGTSNFTFALWLRSPAEIGEVEAEFLAAIPDATVHESSVTINYVKRVGWMLNPDGTGTGEVILPRDPGDEASSPVG
jgi:DNA-binding Lrp family transcriptional regulator